MTKIFDISVIGTDVAGSATARNKGLPGQESMKQIHPKLGASINSIIVTCSPPVPSVAYFAGNRIKFKT